MKRFLSILIVCFAFFNANAQLVNVCGNDSVVLQVENYFNGIIEWQESIDTVNWVTIPEITGTTFKFLPTQTKYYRAVVKTSICAPLHSEITLVQLPPIANAGTDRVIGGTIMTLMGNQMAGSTGKWEILSGTSGFIAEQTNSFSKFSGIFNQNYQLIWTLNNMCGKSSDTVTIRFEENIVSNNFIIVDNTDSIFSTSAEMLTGIYKIKFSDVAIMPADSVMLIGIRSELSFLRKVVSFTLQDSIYTFTTFQGVLDDLFKSGHLNLGDAFNQSLVQMNTKSANIFPTRKTIKENEGNMEQLLLYAAPAYNSNYKSAEVLKSTTGTGIFIQVPDQTLFKTNDESLKLYLTECYVKLTPNFVSDISYSKTWIPPFISVDYLKIGLNNAQFEYNYKLKFEGSAAVNLIEDDKTLLDFKQIIIILIAGLPIEITADLALKASCNISVSAGFSLEQKKNYKKYFTAIVEGSDTRDLNLTGNSTESSTHEDNFRMNAGLSSELKMGPELSFKLYDFIGPYLKLPFIVKMNVCVNTDGDWHEDLTFGIDGLVGVRAAIVGRNIFNFNKKLFSGNLLGTFNEPRRVELQSGNFQNGKTGELLSKPISVKVLSSLGPGTPMVPVRLELEAGNGTVLQKVLFTDSQGKVDVEWLLGSNAENKLKISVLDCDKNDIENSPIFVYARPDNLTYNCKNSDLGISIKTGQTFLYPSITGGTAPYTYSVNGTDYSSVAPQFSKTSPGNFNVYVKDKNLCKVLRSFVVKVPGACDNSDLGLDVTTQDNTLKISGKNGTPPYQYSIDNQNNFSVTNLYNKLTPGIHNVYVQDAKGCTASSKVAIDSGTIPAIKAAAPIDGASYIPTTNLSFSWLVGNYASNQVYDLYLKKGSEAYTQIAQNLTVSAYSYTGTLANGNSYTWKVSVKDQNGTEKDFKEFTFNTASNNTTTPAVPALLQPSNSSSTYSIPVTLKWGLQAGDYKYDLYLDESNATRLIANNLTSNDFVINNPIIGKKYYWKVRIKNMVTGEYQESAVWNFTSLENATNTVTDIEGNVYKTIQIGTQTWMAENLKVTRYRNGDVIPNVSDSNQWTKLANGAYCWYLNDATTYKNTYGALYNWYSLVDNRNVSPVGWHIPTDAEWTILIDFLGGKLVSGPKLKATSGWSYGGNGSNAINGSGSNTSGFEGLPGGYRHESSLFKELGSTGSFWSATEDNETGINSAWHRRLDAAYDEVYRWRWTKLHGFSVRCLKDDATGAVIPTLNTTAAINITSTSASSGGNITSDGGALVGARGVCWNTVGNPVVNGSETMDGTGTGIFTSNLTELAPNTTYYVRAYATNSAGIAYGTVQSFKTTAEVLTGIITDSRDGKIYKWVKIGTQTWMAENLAYLPYVNQPLEIPTSVPYYYVYGYDGTSIADAKATSNFTTYGVLYNWSAAMTACPAGWHLPSSAEWETLRSTLGGIDAAGGNMKTISGWNSPNVGATNSSGFAGLPAGICNYYNGGFGSLGLQTYWYSSTDGSSGSDGAVAMALGNDYAGASISWMGTYKPIGVSVRCIKD